MQFNYSIIRKIESQNERRQLSTANTLTRMFISFLFCFQLEVSSTEGVVLLFQTPQTQDWTPQMSNQLMP